MCFAASFDRYLSFDYVERLSLREQAAVSIQFEAISKLPAAPVAEASQP